MDLDIPRAQVFSRSRFLSNAPDVRADREALRKGQAKLALLDKAAKQARAKGNKAAYTRLFLAAKKQNRYLNSLRRRLMLEELSYVEAPPDEVQEAIDAPPSGARAPAAETRRFWRKQLNDLNAQIKVLRGQYNAIIDGNAIGDTEDLKSKMLALNKKANHMRHKLKLKISQLFFRQEHAPAVRRESRRERERRQRDRRMEDRLYRTVQENHDELERQRARMARKCRRRDRIEMQQDADYDRAARVAVQHGGARQRQDPVLQQEGPAGHNIPVDNPDDPFMNRPPGYAIPARVLLGRAEMSYPDMWNDGPGGRLQAIAALYDKWRPKEAAKSGWVPKERFGFPDLPTYRKSEGISSIQRTYTPFPDWEPLQPTLPPEAEPEPHPEITWADLSPAETSPIPSWVKEGEKAPIYGKTDSEIRDMFNVSWWIPADKLRNLAAALNRWYNVMSADTDPVPLSSVSRVVRNWTQQQWDLAVDWIANNYPNFIKAGVGFTGILWHYMTKVDTKAKHGVSWHDEL